MKSNNSIQWTKLNALKFVIFCQLASTEVKSLQNFVEKPVLLCVGRLATLWLVEKFANTERRNIVLFLGHLALGNIMLDECLCWKSMLTNFLWPIIIPRGGTNSYFGPFATAAQSRASFQIWFILRFRRIQGRRKNASRPFHQTGFFCAGPFEALWLVENL